MAPTPKLPFVEASGSHYDIGRQIGAALRERIVHFLDTSMKRELEHRYRQSRGEKLPDFSWGELQRQAERFLPLMEEHAPHLLEEVRGIASGADIPFADSLILQLRGEVASGMTADHCTAFAVGGEHTRTGETIVGQNSDMRPDMREHFVVVRLKPTGKPGVLMWTLPGMIGYHGLNEAGVAHFANDLPYHAWRMGLSNYVIKRLFLEQESVEGCLDVLRRVPVCRSGNYVLCDNEKIADFEMTPEKTIRLGDEGQGYITHTNHFVGPEFRETNVDALPDSFSRLDRATELIENGLGKIDVEQIKELLGDHQRHPASICRHQEEMVTVGSLIAEPRQGALHVAPGNPCDSGFQTFIL